MQDRASPHRAGMTDEEERKRGRINEKSGHENMSSCEGEEGKKSEGEREKER